MPWWLICYAGAVIAAMVVATVQTVFSLDAAAWASWVQAIGSIGAIVGAFILGRWQFAAQRQRELSERKQQEEAAVAAVYGVARDLVSVCRRTVRKVDRSRNPILEAAIFNSMESLLTRQIRTLDSVPAHDPLHHKFLRDIVIVSSYGQYFRDTASGAVTSDVNTAHAIASRLEHIEGELVKAIANYKDRIARVRADAGT